MKQIAWILILGFLLPGCADLSEMLGDEINVPPEYNQPVYLRVSDDYVMFQAPQSQHDMGDLANFHAQHTFPIVVEGYFKEVFPQAKLIEDEAQIEMKPPEVPAIFEVKMVDLANDIYDEPVTKYRSMIVIAVAMKSPSGHIFWQQGFRAYGQASVDPQFSTGMGPELAVKDAMDQVMDQMQNALLASPEVRNQMLYYQQADEARKGTEVQV